MDGDEVVTLRFATVMVPLTTAETDAPCWMVTLAPCNVQNVIFVTTSKFADEAKQRCAFMWRPSCPTVMNGRTLKSRDATMWSYGNRWAAMVVRYASGLGTGPPWRGRRPSRTPSRRRRDHLR